MAKFKIYSPAGTEIYEGAPSFTGQYMAPGLLEFREIASPIPLDLVAGCYVDYTRTGFRYRIYGVPQVKKQARQRSYGGAFIYQNVQLYDASKMLEFCPFRDLVKGDNRIHFSTQPSISTFEGVDGLARRFEACLQDQYGENSWRVRIATTDDGISQDLADLMAEVREFTVSGVNILECLNKVYEIWPEVGWVYTVESGKDTIIIGGAGLNANEGTYAYGKGSGLATLTRTVANADEMANRIFAYGSSRNMLPRWYNNQTIKDRDSVDIQNLMIPIPEWGLTDVDGGLLPDASKAFVEDAASIAKIGLRPATVYFDGSGGYPEIYPSIRNATIGEVRTWIQQHGPSTKWSPSTEIYPVMSERVDVLKSAQATFDSGLAGDSGKNTIFTEYQTVNASGSETIEAGTRSYTRTVITQSVVFGASEAGTRNVSIMLSMPGFLSLTGATSAVVRASLHKGHPANASVLMREVELSAGATAGTFNFSTIVLSGSKKDIEAATYYLVVELEVSLEESATDLTLIYDASGDISVSLSQYRSKTFTVTLKQIGFDISEQAALGDGKTISMRSGSCVARSFAINSVQYNPASDDWTLECFRSEDESLSQWFPNTDYPVRAGDEFVLLDIAMPELYIGIASQKLLQAAQDLLSDTATERWQYVPEIDAKYMVENGRTIRAGEYMLLSDTAIVGGAPVSVLVDAVTINEGEAEIPTYKVTLRDRKRKTWTESESAPQPTSKSVGAISDATPQESSSGAGDSFWTLDDNGNVTLKPRYENAWVPGWLAAGGIGQGSSGGGTDLNRVWESLTNNTDFPDVKINLAHIPDVPYTKVTGLDSWVAGKGYLLPSSLKTVNGNSLVGSGDITIADGQDGKSAYQIWMDEGNVGTEADFLASLKGDTGVSADYPITIYNGLDSSATDQALAALQGKLLLARIVSLSRRVRPKTPTDHYPFVTDNATTEEFGHAIAEIYINGDIHTSNDIRLRTLRYRQASGSWSGERTEFVIADANGPLIQFLSYETPPSVQFFHTDDYSVCVIVNWCALTADTGYGADYASSSDKTLADGVFDLRNSPIIGLLIASGKLEYDVDESGIAGCVSPTWLQYGIDSAGGINEYSDQAHTTIEGVTPGTTFVFQKPIYRVNLFLDGEFIGQDSDFLPGIDEETEYHSPGDTLYDSIMVSMIGDYTEPNDVEFILNVPTALSILKDAIGTKQDYIKGNADSVVDYSSYVQNGSIDGTTGLLVPYTWYRSLVGLPLPAAKNVVILNPADTASNKRISFWDSSDNLTRVIIVQDMTNYKLEHTASEVKANVTLLSGMSPYPERMSEIQVFTTLDDNVKIDNINGIPIDVPSVPEGVLTGIKAAGTMLPKDGGTVDIPNASSTQSGLLSPADKAKLDIITPGDITISGSGVTKNASAFGFLPTKTASENVAALQAAVDGGGTILVDFPGTYLVNDTVILESDTTLIFGAGVYISLQADKRFLLNEGAENRTYDENISVVGLNLISNGRNVTSTIYGLRGYIAFFYIRNLYISHFQLLDGGGNPFVIHVCTFENVMIENIRVEGNKDAVHFGRGTKFVVRHGLFKTYDDPIAVNAHDYPTSNPEYGDIVDGLVEDCYDLADSSTVGYFARLLPGAWVDWSSGMSVHGFGDTVVSEGRIYATTGTMGTTQTSTVKPTFASGTQTLSDGVTWTMMQDTGVTHSATCKNIHFRNIHLQKDRPTAIQALLDNSSYSRSYYPGAVVPVIRNLTLENIFVEAEITNILNGSAPIDIVKVINSDTTKLVFSYTSETGLTYPRTDVVMMGCTFRGTGSVAVITGSSSRSVYAKISGSIVESALTPSVSNVTLISNDIGIS